MARRFLLYFAWSRPRETSAELGTLENRYPALFELRRAIWPDYEWAAEGQHYPQGIGGFLDHVILHDFQRFIRTVTAHTGLPVSVAEREARGVHTPLDDALLQQADTVIVVSLDHLVTEQSVSPGETQALQQFLSREGACLFVCPHHDVGATGGQAERSVELAHHGDRLVPSQQRIGGFARSLLAALGLPVENRYGLSPARTRNGDPAPLEVARTQDTLGVLQGVETFNLHPHLPHLEPGPGLLQRMRVLARQAIAPEAPAHPFVEEGRTHFNALLWAPPEPGRAGDVLVGDATLWSEAFGGLPSLLRFWQNLARWPTHG